MSGLLLRLAFRDLRGGLSGLGWVVACLALGVAIIAAAGSLDAGLRQTLREDGQALLGGDLQLRLTYRPPTATEMAFFRGFGTVSQAVEMRAMARRLDGSAQTLVEIKAIEGPYPLYGQLLLDPQQEIAVALQKTADGWGIAVDSNLLERLGLAIGDRLSIGDASLIIRATIRAEPDRLATPMSFGPRLLMDSQALPETGLVRQGSLIRYSVLLRLAVGQTVAAFRQAVAGQFADQAWQIRDSSEVAPGLTRFLNQITLFLTMVGLTALLVGGIGVANGAGAFLESRQSTVAILKCLGASNRQILGMQALEVAVLAILGIALGLMAGALVPYVLLDAIENQLPMAARRGIFWQPLALAGAFGGLIALAFAAGPLGRAAGRPAAGLLREASIGREKNSWSVLTVILLAGLALAGLAVIGAADRRAAAQVIAFGSSALAAFAGAGTACQWLAGWASRRFSGLALPWRLALSSLHRPGSPTGRVVLSLGLGLTVLTAVLLVEANLTEEVSQHLPAQAPTFFFLDIQDGETDVFDQTVAKEGGLAVKRAAMIRGRITQIDGQPVESRRVAADAQWAVQGDRGVSMAAVQPQNTKLVAGSWWPADYQGPPLLSLDAGIARGFGLAVGQTLSLNILGRELTARIANLREVDWASLAMNFTIILSPNALAGAPLSWIATVHAPLDRETTLERAVVTALPHVSSIRVKEALDIVRQVIAGAGLVIQAAALVTLAVGGLVLAGAIAAGQRRRIRETVLLKVLGASFADLIAAVALEYALLGLFTGLLAALMGGFAGWAVLVFILKLEARLLPGPILGVVLAGGLVVTLVGLAGTSKALQAGASGVLRHPT